MTLERGEVAHRITVMLGLFLQHYLEAAANDVLLVGIRSAGPARRAPRGPGDVPVVVAVELEVGPSDVVLPSRLLEFTGSGINAWTAAEGALM